MFCIFEKLDTLVMQRKNDKLFPERNFWSKDFAITFDEAEKGQLKNHKE
jgi:hypothetical protein